MHFVFEETVVLLLYWLVVQRFRRQKYYLIYSKFSLGLSLAMVTKGTESGLKIAKTK